MSTRLPLRPLATKRYKCLHKGIIQAQTPIRNASSSGLPSEPPKKLRPESPHFVTVPEPPQQRAIPVRNMKGVLPTPRKIFRSNDEKTTEAYLANVTKEPKEPKDFSRIKSMGVRNMVEWKAQVADTRRRNLREGLKELKLREERIDGRIARQSAQKQAAYLKRVSMPEREDVLLTSPSILQSSMDLPPGNRKKHKEDRRNHHERLQNDKLEEKQYDLHRLYMNAKDFILTEQELSEKVEEVFDNEYYKVNEGRGIWDEQGMPDTVTWLLNGGNQRAQAKDAFQKYAEISRERIHRVTEELTGGAYEEPEEPKTRY